MGKYNFDNLIDRKNTKSVKFDSAKERGISEELMPLWVADMDFETAPEIREAVMNRAAHGIYGYTKTDQDFCDSIINWMKRRHGFVTERDWYVFTPGVVFGLSMVVRALTEEGDSVLIQQPVYHPFRSVIEKNNRRLVNSPLIYEDGYYKMDFEDFETKIVQNQVKLFILCNPHNPVGRVWTKEELRQVGEICVKHGVLVLADEIHQDFMFSGHTHIVFADIDETFKEITLTCTSPSKTFNLAGLQISNIIIPSCELREAVEREIERTGYHEPTLFGIEANIAAYEYGEPWLEELKEYLEGNIDFIRDYLNEHLPKVKMIEPEGTYLLWLDFNAYAMTEEILEKKITEDAKLWLNGGTIFGTEGSGFQRVNIATSRDNIKKAMDLLASAFNKL